jgi:hypothetical protein
MIGIVVVPAIMSNNEGGPGFIVQGSVVKIFDELVMGYNKTTGDGYDVLLPAGVESDVIW